MTFDTRITRNSEPRWSVGEGGRGKAEQDRRVGARATDRRPSCAASSKGRELRSSLIPRTRRLGVPKGGNAAKIGLTRATGAMELTANSSRWPLAAF